MCPFDCLFRLLATYLQQLEHHSIRIAVQLDSCLPLLHHSFVLVLPLALGTADDFDKVSTGKVHLRVELLFAVEIL